MPTPDIGNRNKEKFVMENVVLAVHLIIALALIGIVLLQPSEGGSMGSLSGGTGGNTSGRSAASGMNKLTWVFAIAFIITSLVLTVIATNNAANSSVVDVSPTAPIEQFGDAPLVPILDASDAESLLPPTNDAPLAPPVSE